MKPLDCPVCNSSLLKSERIRRQDAWLLNCPLCGEFAITGSLAASLPSTLAGEIEPITKISHSLRKMERSGRTPALTWEIVNEILVRSLPKPSEQADLLVRWIGDNVDGPGETVLVEPNTHASIIGAKSSKGFGLVLSHLFESGLAEGILSEVVGDHGRGSVTLSFGGWEHYEALLRGKSGHGQAFMAMKFGVPELDSLFRDIFKPAAQAAGFNLIKLDEEPKAGLIDSRLRVEIQSSDFLIADLSHDNNGAYWEAGYAEGLGKPVIYTCEVAKFKEKKSHFDTNHHLTVTWDNSNPELAGNELKAVIRATLPEIAIIED